MAKKYIPIEDVEARADILQIARMLGLEIKPSGAQFRCQCPVHGGDNRSLCVSPQVSSRRGSLGVFFCQSEKTGGDRVGLVAHVMEIGQQDAIFFLAEQLGMETASSDTVTSTTVTSSRATPPPAREEPKASRVFDPQAFALKLVFSPEVQALGLEQADAERLGIGFHPQRKMLYLAVRNGDGSIAGFVGIKDPQTLKLPPQWLPASNVIQLLRA